jgi:hypothetical protein
VSFFIVITLAGLGMADGGPFALERALHAYLYPQIAAFIIAYLVLRMRDKREEPANE